MKIVLSAAFVANTLVGHFCIMPIAYAEAMPVQHDEVIEMNMTPLEPISPAHCEHCVHIGQENRSPMTGDCAGHCLSQASSSVAAVSNTQALHTTAALPATVPNIVAFADDHYSYADSTAPPVSVPVTRTVVLLQ